MESHDVGFFLPGWMQRNENVVLTSPHDDDVLFGCGLMLQILKEEGAEIYVAVMTNGDKGYCNEERLGKNNIVEARKEATFRAYDEIGIDANHLIRFEYPDSELAFHIDWKLISRMIEFYRNVDATRLFVP
ncbi:MAG TPA: PIG-L family deacetylase, partial [Bacteroidia bacterium]|nr:PIG-L family deacetylase [Bacteroidia bacterium]